MIWPAVVVGGLLGLAVGSFLNVVVWRVPRHESVVSPPSACPRCGHGIRPRDNVPVLSWILLHGRCRDCAEPISARYPAVEAVTAALFALTTWWTGPGWSTAAMLYLVAVGVALTLIDVDHHRLPDAIVLPSYAVGVVLLTVASWPDLAAGDWSALLRAVVGAAILFAFYFVLLVVHPRGMGLGDVKLAGLLGLYLGWAGWSALVVGAFAAFLLGGVFAIALLVTGRAGRTSGIPFGPWMLVGAAVGLVAGAPLGDWYLGFLV